VLSAPNNTSLSQLVQTQRTSSTLQNWVLSAPQIDPFNYNLSNISSGYFADMSGSSLSSGGAMIQWTPNAFPFGTTNQVWSLSLNADGSYSIENFNSSLCVAVAGNSNAIGASIVQQTCSGSAYQHWRAWNAPGVGGYTFTFTSLGSGLTLAASSNAIGAQLVQAQTTPSSTLQTWMVSYTPF
jgi:hexosaminidase